MRVTIMHLKYIHATLQGEVEVTEVLVSWAPGASQAYEVKLLDGLGLPTQNIQSDSSLLRKLHSSPSQTSRG